MQTMYLGIQPEFWAIWTRLLFCWMMSNSLMVMSSSVLRSIDWQFGWNNESNDFKKRHSMHRLILWIIYKDMATELNWSNQPFTTQQSNWEKKKSTNQSNSRSSFDVGDDRGSDAGRGHKDPRQDQVLGAPKVLVHEQQGNVLLCN